MDKMRAFSIRKRIFLDRSTIFSTKMPGDHNLNGDETLASFIFYFFPENSKI